MSGELPIERTLWYVRLARRAHSTRRYYPASTMALVSAPLPCRARLLAKIKVSQFPAVESEIERERERERESERRRREKVVYSEQASERERHGQTEPLKRGATANNLCVVTRNCLKYGNSLIELTAYSL